MGNECADPRSCERVMSVPSWRNDRLSIVKKGGQL